MTRIRKPSRRAAVAAAILALLSGQAGAQVCGSGPEMQQWLADNHAEAVVSRGQMNPQMILEIWANPESGSFTAVILTADGQACIMAAGQHWQRIEYVSPDAGEDM